MEIKTKEQKIRDIIIFSYNIIPQVVDVDRHVVYVKLQEKDVVRLGLDITLVATELGSIVDRRVEVSLV